MKAPFRVLTLTGAVLLATLAGCRGKSDAGGELEKAAKIMAAAEPAQASPSPPNPAAQLSQTAPESTASPRPADQMKQALAAYKAGELENAVTRLQKLRATTAMSPQQRMSLNDAMAAVMGEIYGLAAKGDPRAIQAVKQYEAMQTLPH